MPRLLAATVCVLLFPAITAAQDPANKPAAEPNVQAAPALPAMVAPWTGSDYSRSPNARELVQRREAWKAEQRAARLAGLGWLGYSPARPPVSTIPIMGSYGGFIGLGTYNSLPGAIYQPGLPTLVIGRAAEVQNR